MFLIKDRIYNELELKQHFGVVPSGVFNKSGKYSCIFVVNDVFESSLDYGGWVSNKIYQCTGRESSEEMTFSGINKVVRDHEKEGVKLFFLEKYSQSEFRYISELLLIDFSFLTEDSSHKPQIVFRFKILSPPEKKDIPLSAFVNKKLHRESIQFLFKKEIFTLFELENSWHLFESEGKFNRAIPRKVFHDIASNLKLEPNQEENWKDNIIVKTQEVPSGKGYMDNTSIEDYRQVLSVRAYNVCIDNGLTSLSKLKRYFEGNGDFLKLPASGQKTNKELIKLINQYGFNLNDSKSEETVQDINEASFLLSTYKNILSVRAFNVCADNNLETLDDLQGHFNRHGTFKNLSNAGEKTNKELTEFLEKAYQLALQANKANGRPPMSFLEELNFVFQNLEEQQRLIIQDQFSFFIRTLSVRGQNSLEKLSEADSTVSLQSVLRNLSFLGFDIEKIPNVGKKTKKELGVFFRSILQYCRDIEDLNKPEILAEIKPRQVVSRVPSLSPDDRFKILNFFKKYRKELNHSQFPIFSFCRFVFEETDVLSKRDHLIFKYRFNYLLNFDSLKLEAIGNKLGITRERVRQIIKSGNIGQQFWCLLTQMAVVYGVEIVDLDTYGRDIDEDVFQLDESEINEIEETFFTKKFIQEVIALFLNDSYLLVGFNDEGRKYFVSKEILDVLRIEDLLNYFSNLLEEKRKQDIPIQLKGLVFQFAKNEDLDIDLIDRCVSAIEDVLFIEFNLLTGIDGSVLIKRNIKKKLYEYIVEILDENGEPMHVDEIQEELFSIGVDVGHSIESIRSQLINNKLLFIYVDSSTYGLKKWEKRGDVKGGTIKDLTEEYLKLRGEPIHIFEIAMFVLKYRDTNKYNIFSNLKNDPSSRFSYKGGGFFGLSNVEYSNEWTSVKALSPSEVRVFLHEYLGSYRSLLPYEDLISLYAKKYGAYEVQIRSVLHERIESGDFILKEDGFMYKNNF